MDTNLIFFDITNFLDKYQKFINKNIYITNNTYKKFISQYQYLYDELEQYSFLISDNPNIKKLINIKNNSNKLLKLHNKNYLNNIINNHYSFDDIYSNDIIDTTKRKIILCEEENMICVVKKNEIPLIISKIYYLIYEKNISPNKILIISNDDNTFSFLKDYFTKRKINLSILNIEKEKKHLLEPDEALLTNEKKYNIILSYIENILFPNKEEFNQFIKNFSPYLYLHQSYDKFNNFNDYYDYIYQRKYLSSKLTLKKYNEQTINKRKKYLRTICNEFMNTINEVDIANFLYLNSINYSLSKEKSSITLNIDNKTYHIYIKDDYIPPQTNNSIIIPSKNSLEVLAYELIKRRIPFEKVSDEEVFIKLKETTKSSYFTKFIKTFLPIIDDYIENKELNNNLSSSSKKYLLKIIDYYQKYLDGNKLVTDEELNSRLEKVILKKKYNKIIIKGTIDINLPNPTFQVINELPTNEVLRDNIKLFIDYQKYLYTNSKVPIPNVYINMHEYNHLTSCFISNNLACINNNLSKINKDIYVLFYDDYDKYLVQKMRVLELKKIKLEKNNKTIVVKDINDINLLICKYYTKIDKDNLKDNEGNIIPCKRVDELNNLVDYIIYPFFLCDNNFSKNEDLIKNKLLILKLLSKCKNGLYLIAKKTDHDNIVSLLKGLKKVHIEPKILV